MKINDFISTLPRSVINGNTIRLPDNVLRRIFELARLNKKDIFYDLGCGNSNAIYIASREYKVKKAIGIEKRKIAVRETLKKTQGIKNVVVINEDIRRVDLSDGNVFLFWFHDDKITKKTDKIDFPFFVSQTPFKFANSIEEQIKAVYGHKCLDFTAAWLLGDKYLESLEVVPAKYKRFLNILYSMIIWINAWNMEVACEDQIPPPVESYLGILKTFFNIDLSSLIENSHS